ncbi:MAG: uracil-DNA glycosylase [Candidatus Omnitrophica bacterium]|nr:uracil-DNA glycosylase [Candidatus Omnitrophota bacterium]MCM8768624.1 uracil-DNA glycosylase [Candidatus Omnitrophota bacterium]
MVAAVKWQKLEERCLRCNDCGLASSRTQVVFGSGSLVSRIMLVGEAPGFNEDRKGKPFCGRAGAVLDELLSTINLDRRQVYITNVVKCRPPGNRDPMPEELVACSPYLQEQIELLQPEVIACLGRFSLRTILRFFGLSPEVSLSQVHGQVFTPEGDLFQTVQIVALFHPAVATYRPEAMDGLKKDFAVLAKI